MGFNGLLTKDWVRSWCIQVSSFNNCKNLRVKRWKKANIHKRYVRNIILHWQSSRWKASETHFQQTYVNGFWLWIESYIRESRESKMYDMLTFLPSSYPLLCGFPTCWHPFHHILGTGYYTEQGSKWYMRSTEYPTGYPRFVLRSARG